MSGRHRRDDATAKHPRVVRCPECGEWRTDDAFTSPAPQLDAFDLRLTPYDRRFLRLHHIEAPE